MGATVSGAWHIHAVPRVSGLLAYVPLLLFDYEFNTTSIFILSSSITPHTLNQTLVEILGIPRPRMCTLVVQQLIILMVRSCMSS